MSNVLKSKTLLGVMIVAVMIAGALMAFAITASAQQAVVLASDIQYAATVKQGSSGQAVIIWQRFLNGYSSANLVNDGAFGPLTSAAAKVWQASRSLVADGVLGPMSRASAVAQINANVVLPGPGTFPAGCSSASGYSVTTGLPCGSSLPAGCSSTAGYSPTTGTKCDSTATPSTSGPLTGGAGSADYTLMSSLTNEEVGEDEEDVEVAGLEVEADGSDLELTAVRLVFNEGTAGSDFEDYATEVSVWLDGDEIGRVDGSEFNDDNDWSKTVSLEGAIIRDGETGELTVAVSAVGNLDTNDATDTWTVDFRSVRYVDAQGASTSEDPGTAVRTFSFESFATATNAELKISEGTANDDVNDGRMINVHATSVTNDEVIFEFSLEAVGSDLKIETFGVNVDVTGAGHVDDVISGGTAPAIFLELDGEQYGTAAYFDEADATDVGTDEDVVFDDVDFTLNAGDKITGRILVDLLALNADIDTGDTIAVTLGETESDQATLVDVEDESGTALVDADITGSATSDAHQVRDVGFVFKLLSTSASVTTPADGTNPDIGTFKQTFSATAFDGDVALDKTCEEDGDQAADGEGVSVVGTNAGSNALVCSLSTTDAINSTVSANSWLIPSGATRNFTITTAITAETSAFAKAYIESLGWDVDANAADTLLYLTAGLGEDNTSTGELYLTDTD